MKKKKQLSLKEFQKRVDELQKIANGPCTCDGGNTNGCSACVAERRLKEGRI